MGAVVAIDALLDQRRVWKGRPATRPASGQPTGHAGLDAALPIGGWPEGALSEILIPADGVGELGLLWPALARLTRAGERVVLVAPPYVPFAPAWQAAGVDLRQLEMVEAASPRDALWATEQCLRSGSCGAVLCWPAKADDRALRRLQVAAEAGEQQLAAQAKEHGRSMEAEVRAILTKAARRPHIGIALLAAARDVGGIDDLPIPVRNDVAQAVDFE